MKVLVLGGGVIGITSAWYLSRAGHEVTIVDRAAGPGLETSFANGGQVSWGAGVPWAAPGVPVQALKWLVRPHSPLLLRPRLDPAMWRWLFRMLGQCTSERFAINRARMLRLSRYSHDCLVGLRSDTGIHYDEQTTGLLELFRSQESFDRAAREISQLAEWGVNCRLLDRAACLAQEPALRSASGKIKGGLHFPDDESGDCYQFTQKLAAMAESNGVRFMAKTRVDRLEADGNRLMRMQTSAGPLTADAYVLACGSYSPLLLRPLGITLPVYPVKGYSVTAELTDSARAPAGSVTDSEYKVVLTRLGNRLRGAGTAELAGYDLSLRPSRLATIQHVLTDLFPGACDITPGKAWCGLRPMTPDNPPVLGTTPYTNLFLNTGHGTLGWTMACGSGKILADLVSGCSAEIDLDGLTLSRFL